MSRIDRGDRAVVFGVLDDWDDQPVAGNRALRKRNDRKLRWETVRKKFAERLKRACTVGNRDGYNSWVTFRTACFAAARGWR
jgi:hypothetical protein